jgi:RhtB (resistance to homoserine/threonine) family protein
MDANVSAFLAVAALVILAPGPDTALVTKNALLYGRGAALATSAGVNVGLLVWTLASALGVAAIVHESETVFTVLKLIGGAYLVWLGLQALRASRRGAGPGGSRVPVERRIDSRRAFRHGLFSNLANPKIAAFFTSLLPQFIAPGHSVLVPFLLLGGLFVAMTLSWLSAYALMAARAGNLLTRPRVKAALDRITGLVLVGLGLRLATESR